MSFDSNVGSHIQYFEIDLLFRHSYFEVKDCIHYHINDFRGLRT